MYWPMMTKNWISMKAADTFCKKLQSFSVRSLKVVDLYVIVTDDIVTNNIAKDKIVIDDIVTNEIVSHASKVSLLMSSSATNIATGWKTITSMYTHNSISITVIYIQLYKMTNQQKHAPKVFNAFHSWLSSQLLSGLISMNFNQKKKTNVCKSIYGTE